MLEQIGQFVQETFVNRLQTGGMYNFAETIIYALILISIAFFVVYPFFDKRKIKFDIKFALAVLPYVIMGSALRVFEDLHLVPRSVNPLEIWFYAITPGIYLAIGIFTILALVVSIYASRKMGWNVLNTFRNIGIIGAIPILAIDIINFKIPIGAVSFISILFLAALVSFAVMIAVSAIRKGFFTDRMNVLALFAQMLDASATFYAVGFLSCGEQHPLTNAILQVTPALFYVVKIAVVLLILYYADKELKNQNLKDFIKLLIIILGFAPGMRDALTVAVGTCL